MTSQRKNNLFPLIFTLVRLIRERTSCHGKENIFSVAQFKILAFIEERERPTMKEIADFLYITSPSATEIISRLVKAGELERIYEKKDHRIIHLILTKQGKKTITDRRKILSKRMEKVFKCLSEEERSDFAAILEKIIHSYNR